MEKQYREKVDYISKKKERGILMYDNIISEIRLIVKSNGGKDDIKNDDIMLLNGITPVQLVGILLELNNLYNVQIPDKSILNSDLETISEIAKFIKNNRKERRDV